MTTRILIVEGHFYQEIANLLATGAIHALEKAGAKYERLAVPGALEIPQVIRMAGQTNKYDGYVALGCVIRGATSHYDIVCNESARALTWLTVDPGLIIGNGILTCDTYDQAEERADPARMNKGGGAAGAVLSLLEIRHRISK